MRCGLASAEAILIAGMSIPAWADFTGTVVAVADGDTITVLRDHERVGLFGWRC